MRSLLFANNDCTGQAYIETDFADRVMGIPTAVAPLDAPTDPNNETLYEADLNNQVNVTFNSFWSHVDGCVVVTLTRDAYLANPVFNLSSLYLPPYNVE